MSARTLYFLALSFSGFLGLQGCGGSNDSTPEKTSNDDAEISTIEPTKSPKVIDVAEGTNGPDVIDGPELTDGPNGTATTETPAVAETNETSVGTCKHGICAPLKW